MILKLIFGIAVPVLLLYFLFRWAVKKWKQADREETINDKMNEMDKVHKSYQKIKDVKVDKFKKEEKRVSDFIDEK